METKAVYVFLCKFVLSSKHLIRKKNKNLFLRLFALVNVSVKRMWTTLADTKQEANSRSKKHDPNFTYLPTRNFY